jgi:hypothetical protein
VVKNHTRKESDSWKIHFTKREILFIRHCVFLGGPVPLIPAYLHPVKTLKQKGLCLHKDYHVTARGAHL